MGKFNISVWHNFKLYFLLICTLNFCVAQANVLGTDAQTFNPINDGLDFVTVHSSKTLEIGFFNFGFFYNLSSNSLPILRNESNPNFLETKDLLSSLDFNFSIGLLKNWEIGFSVPYLVEQTVKGCNSCAFFESAGITETRGYIKNGNYSINNYGLAWVLSQSKNQINQNPFSGDNAGNVTTLEFVLDKTFNGYQLAFNFGHRWRQIGQRISSNDWIGRIGNQYIYSLGVSHFKPEWDSNLIFELFGSQPSEKSPDGSNYTNRSEKGLEWLLGIKRQFNDSLAFHFGIGREVVRGFGTPDLRMYTGINYSFNLFNQSSVSSTEHLVDNSKKEKVFTLSNMSFEFDSINLTSKSEDLFIQVSDSLLSLPKVIQIEIEGHTDSMGDEAYNLSLSQKRAHYLSERLDKIFIAHNRSIPIKASGYGESMPVAANTNQQGRALNRRVVIKVSLAD